MVFKEGAILTDDDLLSSQTQASHGEPHPVIASEARQSVDRHGLRPRDDDGGCLQPRCIPPYAPCCIAKYFFIILRVSGRIRETLIYSTSSSLQAQCGKRGLSEGRAMYTTNQTTNLTTAPMREDTLLSGVLEALKQGL